METSFAALEKIGILISGQEATNRIALNVYVHRNKNKLRTNSSRPDYLHRRPRCPHSFMPNRVDLQLWPCPLLPCLRRRRCGRRLFVR